MAELLPLHPDVLTPRDMQRAKAVCNGESPYKVITDPDRMFTLVIWCVRTRTDPGFTWEQALDTPFGDPPFGAPSPDVDPDGDQPPPIASPDGPGGSDARNANVSARKTPSGRRRGSAATTGSAPRSTTG